jgi:hypothetical protein
MDDLPEVTPVQQQLTRERIHEREQLTEQITILRSLLRLDADGIGDGEDLVDVLEQTRTCLERFSVTVQREAINLDCGTPQAEFEPCDNILDATDAPCSPDGSTRVRSLSGSSTRSSWRSTPSTASTSATSISPPDSFLSHRFSSPPVFESPYTNRLRRFGGSEIEEGDEDEVDEGMEEEMEEEEDVDMDYEGGPDVSDASFQRLSTILASLQRQAEASLCSPPTIEEETSEDVASFWGDGKGGDISPVSAKVVTYRGGSPSSQPGSPGLMGHKKSLSFSLSQSSGKRASWTTGQLFSQFSPTTSQTVPGMRRRSGLAGPGHERQASKDSVRSTEGKTAEMELERTVMEFLEFIGRSNGGEEDVMFRWVWIYMMGGGFIWLVVGWILGWGCNACGESLVCERR